MSLISLRKDILLVQVKMTTEVEDILDSYFDGELSFSQLYIILSHASPCDIYDAIQDKNLKSILDTQELRNMISINRRLPYAKYFDIICRFDKDYENNNFGPLSVIAIEQGNNELLTHYLDIGYSEGVVSHILKNSHHLNRQITLQLLNMLKKNSDNTDIVNFSYNYIEKADTKVTKLIFDVYNEDFVRYLLWRSNVIGGSKTDPVLMTVDNIQFLIDCYNKPFNVNEAALASTKFKNHNIISLFLDM